MKKHTFLPLAALSLLFMTIIASCKSDDKKADEEKFEFNLAPGKSYEYTMNTDMNQAILNQSTDISIGGRFIVTVNEADTTSARLTISYEQFSMGIDANGMKFSVDTDKPGTGEKGNSQNSPEEFMGSLFNGIKGKTFSMTVGKRGDILAVSGFNRIVAEMLDSMELDEQQQMEARLSLADQFSDGSAREQFSQLFNFFPNYLTQAGGLKKGSSWTVHSTRGGMRMPMRYTTKYTITNVTPERVFLNSAASISSDETPVSGTETGTLEVDRASGLLLKADFLQNVEVTTDAGKILVKGKGNIAGKAL